MTDATRSSRICTMRRFRVGGRLSAGPRRRGDGGESTFFGTWKKTVQQLARKYKTKMELIIILTTMPDDDRARELARTLVEERLAACVNVLPPMTSTYRWKEAVEVEAE